MTRKAVVAALFAVAGLAAQYAHAQGASVSKYPERPIRLVVGFPPGGATDIFARILSQHMPESIGQQVVVDNRGGASGTIAAAMVAKAPPDGYTIMMVPSGPYTISASTYPNLPYDAVRDFTGVSLLAWVTNVIVVPQVSPVKTLQDVIRMAKDKPGRVTFSSSGSGSLHHLAGEVLKRLTGTDMIHVPFKGAGPALAALAGSEVTFGFTSMPSAMPLINAKRIADRGDERKAYAGAARHADHDRSRRATAPRARHQGVVWSDRARCDPGADRQQAQRRDGEGVQAPGRAEAADRNGCGVRGQLSAGTEQAARKRRKDVGEVGEGGGRARRVTRSRQTTI